MHPLIPLSALFLKEKKKVSEEKEIIDWTEREIKNEASSSVTNTVALIEESTGL